MTAHDKSAYVNQANQPGGQWFSVRVGGWWQWRWYPTPTSATERRP